MQNPEDAIDARELAIGANEPEIHDLYAFWDTCRGGNTFPSQRDLDLIRIPALLPSIFIVDLIGDDDYYYRYMGSNLDRYYGVSLTGMRAREYRKSGRLIEVAVDFFHRIARNAEMGILTTQLPSEAQDWLIYTRAALPVADDHEIPNKIIGIVLVKQAKQALHKLAGSLATDRQEGGHADTVFGKL